MKGLVRPYVATQSRAPAQMSLSDALIARDEAVDRVSSHAPQNWMDEAEKGIRWCAIAFDEFTTDEVFQFLRDGGVPDPHEPRAMGAAIRKARAAGWITPSGKWRQTARKSRHVAPIQVWRSRIVEPR